MLLHNRTAILTVVPTWPFLDSLLHAGNVAVDLFFVLSGFVLTVGYGAWFTTLQPARWSRFLARRLARIYPLHVAITLALSVGITLITLRGDPPSDPQRYTVASLLANLLLMHAWGTDRLLTWNQVSWSISAEWFAYLLFPLVVVVTARVQRAGLLLAIGFAAVVLELAVMLTVSDAPLVRVSGAFVLGVCLAQVYGRGWHDEWPWDRIAFAAAVATVLLLGALTADGAQWLATPLFGVLIFALAHQRGPAATALSGRRMVFLGEASYALYLLHGVIAPWLPSPSVIPDAPAAARAALLTFDLVVIVLVAASVHVVFERPARERLLALRWPLFASRSPDGPRTPRLTHTLDTGRLWPVGVGDETEWHDAQHESVDTHGRRQGQPS